MYSIRVYLYCWTSLLAPDEAVLLSEQLRWNLWKYFVQHLLKQLPLCCCTGAKGAGAWPVVLAMVAGEVRLFSVMQVGTGAGMVAGAGVTGAICFLLPRASLVFFFIAFRFRFFRKVMLLLKFWKRTWSVFLLEKFFRRIVWTLQAILQEISWWKLVGQLKYINQPNSPRELLPFNKILNESWYTQNRKYR